MGGWGGYVNMLWPCYSIHNGEIYGEFIFRLYGVLLTNWFVIASENAHQKSHDSHILQSDLISRLALKQVLCVAFL